MAKNFGDILDQWETGTAKPYGKKRIAREKKLNTEKSKRQDPQKEKTSEIHQIQKAWMLRYGVVDKDAAKKPDHKTSRPLNPDKIKIDARIDLHGMTAEQAETALDIFFDDCVRMAYKKVLIIHGKGNHSKEEPVLKKLVQHYIERNPHAGKSGKETAANGGNGATWVLLK
ncbi:MAG: Smr/MutS family protein [Treponemataceae bacterium]